MTMTHTHIVEYFANPFLVCVSCGNPVRGFVKFEGQVEGCEHRGDLVPCGHTNYESTCPSWSPVSGCNCNSVFGLVNHRPPSMINPSEKHNIDPQIVEDNRIRRNVFKENDGFNH